MTIALWTAVALIGGVGSVLRFLVDRAVGRLLALPFPFGTLSVNVVASLALGLVTGRSGVSTTVLALVGTGFCGALSTYSTYSFETVRLAEDGAWGAAALNVLVSVAAGLGAASLGVWVGGLL